MFSTVKVLCSLDQFDTPNKMILHSCFTISATAVLDQEKQMGGRWLIIYLVHCSGQPMVHLSCLTKTQKGVGYVLSSTVKQEHRVLRAQLETFTKSEAGSVRDNREKVTAAFLSFQGFSFRPKPFEGWFRADVYPQTRSLHFNNQRTDSRPGKLVRGRHQHFAGVEPRTTLLKSVDTAGIIVTKDQLLADDYHF